MKRKKITIVLPAIVLGVCMVICGCNRMDRYIPVVETFDPDSVLYFSAMFHGLVKDDHGYAIEGRGFCWSTSGVPTLSDSYITAEGAGLGPFSMMARTLPPNSRLYVRAWATNKAGTGYGSTMIVTTKLNADASGNIIRAVRIGNQIWMAENLAVDRFSNGDPLTSLGGPVDPGLFYNHDSANLKNYGRLYHAFTVQTGRICPDGWRMPTFDDWDELSDFLGGHQVAGGKLKETDTTYWQYKNVGATNEVGFGARGGGKYGPSVTFNELKAVGYFWVLDTVPEAHPMVQQLIYNSEVLLRANTGVVGLNAASIRCILDI